MATALPPPPPGRHANVVQFGADSRSGQRVASSLEHQLSLDHTPSRLFLDPTVRSLAEQLQPPWDEAQAPAQTLGS